MVLPPFVAKWELDHLKEQLATTDNPDLVPQLILMAVAFSFAAFGLVYVELALVEKLSSLTFAVLAVAKELLVVVLSMLINKVRVVIVRLKRLGTGLGRGCASSWG